MRYLALRDFALHLERVKERSDAGGHSASEPALRRIYDASLANLPRALADMDRLWVYDNSSFGGPPALILEAHDGVVQRIAGDPPQWLVRALDL